MQYLPSRDRPPKSLASTLTPSEGMPMPESSRPSERRADNAGMTSRPTLANPRTAPPSATAGSPATSRPATSTDRSPSCRNTSQTQRSSPTLPQDSTTGAKGLATILERIHQGDKLTLVVAYRDRLARFGTELIEQILQRNGGELLVLNQRDLSPPEELTQDLLAILTVFSARANGLRRYRKEIQEDQNLPRPVPEDQA